MNNVLIVNAYSARNRGDAAIVVAMIKYLQDMYPNINIRVMSSYYIENESIYRKYGAESVPAVWLIRSGDSVFYRYGHGLRMLLTAILNPRSKRFQAYKDADIILGAGGGYLYSSRRGPLGVGLLCSLFHYWLGKHLGKMVVGFPQSVGPLRYRFDRWLTGAVLRGVELFIARERESSKLLHRLGVNCFREEPDVAFYLARSSHAPAVNKDSDRQVIRMGVTVLDWRFAVPNSSWSDVEQYLNKLSSAIRSVKESIPSLVVSVFPQVDVGGKDSDVDVSRCLVDLLGDGIAECVSIPEECGPDELINLYGMMDLFVASRMHSAILALNSGIPVVALSYQPKTRGTFELLGLGAYVLDADKFQSSMLVQLLLDAVNPSTAQFQCAAEKAKEQLRNGLLLNLIQADEC